MKLQAIRAKVAAQSGGGKDMELGSSGGERSKEDILSEIRRLQAQMAALESRVATSSKMNGSAVVSASAESETQANGNTAITTEAPQGDKDK